MFRRVRFVVACCLSGVVATVGATASASGEEVPAVDEVPAAPDALGTSFAPRPVEDIVASLPEGVTLDMLFPEGGPTMEQWVEVTNLTVSREGGWVPGLSDALLQPSGDVELSGRPEVTGRIAEQLAAKGIRTATQVPTDGEPLAAVPLTANGVNQPWNAGMPINLDISANCTGAFSWWRASGIGRDWFHSTAGHCGSFVSGFTNDPTLIFNYNWNNGFYNSAWPNHMNSAGASVWNSTVAADFSGYYLGFNITGIPHLAASRYVADHCNNGTCQFVPGNQVLRSLIGNGWLNIELSDPAQFGLVCKHGQTTGTSCGIYVGIVPGTNGRRVAAVNQCGAFQGDSGGPVVQYSGSGFNALGWVSYAVGTPAPRNDNFGVPCSTVTFNNFHYFPTWMFELYMGNGNWNVVNLWRF